MSLIVCTSTFCVKWELINITNSASGKMSQHNKQNEYVHYIGRLEWICWRLIRENVWYLYWKNMRHSIAHGIYWFVHYVNSYNCEKWVLRIFCGKCGCVLIQLWIAATCLKCSYSGLSVTTMFVVVFLCIWILLDEKNWTLFSNFISFENFNYFLYFFLQWIEAIQL